MKVKVDSVSAVQKKLSISIPEDTFQNELNEAFLDVGKRARIPGFRPGKIPRSILEKKFGSSIEAEVYQELVRRSIAEAIDANGLEAIRVSNISEPKRKKGQGFSYVASLEVKPAFEPKDYLNIKVKTSKPQIKPEHIEEVLKRLQESHAVLKHKEDAKTPKDGDLASIVIEDVKAKEPQDQKEQICQIGNKSLEPHVEKAIKGLSIGEATTVKLKPQDQKQELEARITLKSIKEKVLPEINDEFAKSMGPFENLKALRDQVEKDVKQEAENKAKAENVQKLLQEILKKNPIDLPETMVQQEIENLLHGMKQHMAQAGVKKLPEDYSEEKLRKDLQKDAERRVHEQLVIEAIAKKEKIEVQESEINKHIQSTAKASKVPPAEVRSYYEKTGKLGAIRFQMLAQKTLDFLASKDNIK